MAKVDSVAMKANADLEASSGLGDGEINKGMASEMNSVMENERLVNEVNDRPQAAVESDGGTISVDASGGAEGGQIPGGHIEVENGEDVAITGAEGLDVNDPNLTNIARGDLNGDGLTDTRVAMYANAEDAKAQENPVFIIDFMGESLSNDEVAERISLGEAAAGDEAGKAGDDAGTAEDAGDAGKTEDAGDAGKAEGGGEAGGAEGAGGAGGNTEAGEFGAPEWSSGDPLLDLLMALLAQFGDEILNEDGTINMEALQAALEEMGFSAEDSAKLAEMIGGEDGTGGIMADTLEQMGLDPTSMSKDELVDAIVSGNASDGGEALEALSDADSQGLIGSLGTQALGGTSTAPDSSSTGTASQFAVASTAAAGEED